MMTSMAGSRISALVLMIAFGISGFVIDDTSAASGPACAVTAEALENEPLLPKTLATLIRGGEVTIVAVGGASTQGGAAGGGDHAWPAALARALGRKFPNASLKIVNRSVSRDTAELMLKRIERDVLPLKPTLVIWETGTTDAVRGTDITEFADTLERGVKRLQETNAEVLLMDMQFSRHSGFIVNLNRYLVIMRGVAEFEDIPLFPRHDIMRSWADSGVFDYFVRGRNRRRQLALDVYECIGKAVATMITRGPQQ
ncbi:MAG: acyl-CoA thioesterase-1 [Alphaproteobacteria bacterium]|jgi:acyl-CoA thioesterase-1